MWKIAYFFLNETRFIYEKIIHDNINSASKNSVINMNDFDELGNKIIESVIDDKELNKWKRSFRFIKDMSYFLKNINLKYNDWSLTYKI